MSENDGFGLQIDAFLFQQDCWICFSRTTNYQINFSASDLFSNPHWPEHQDVANWKFEGIITRRRRAGSLIRKYANIIQVCELLARRYWKNINFVYDALILGLTIIAHKEEQETFAPHDKENLIDWAERVPGEWRELHMFMKYRLVIAKLEQRLLCGQAEAQQR